MAKTTGPLFSLDASGTVGKTVVYSKWHGRNYVRRRVVPANPQTTDQIAFRNAFRAMAAGVRFAALTALVHPDLTLTDKAEIAAITPSEFAWNGYIVQKGLGVNNADFIAGQALYTALQAAEKTAWVNAAAALVPAIADVQQGAVGGGFGTPLSKGAVFFAWVYALYKAGLSVTIPGATPPTYA